MKKEYIRSKMQVLPITPCTILAASELEEGRSDDDKPQMDLDGYYYGD